MGLIADIYKAQRYGDCSNHGISERFDGVTIVNVDGPFKPSDERPAVALVRGNLPGTVKIVPAVETSPGVYEADARHSMAGGAFVSTSDSRFTEAVEKLTGARFYGAVSFHDRYEG